MKRYRNLIWAVVLLSDLFIIIGSSVADAQAETNIRGRIAFDFPKTPEAKIELDLSGKSIGLVAKAATVELREMLEGVNVRGYHCHDANFGEVNRYYENKLKKEGWDVIAKVKHDDEIVEMRILSNQDIVTGLFIMISGNEETILVNIFGRINPEKMVELLDSLNVDDLGDFDIDLADLGMRFELNLPEFNADYKPRRQGDRSGKRGLSEQLDWTLEDTGISVISAETINGSITLEGSTQDKVIVRAFKRVSARNTADAEKFAKKVQVHVERHGKEIKIYKKRPKPPRGIGVSVTYEIQCPSAVDVKLHTTNGKIVLHGGDGRIHAITTNGKIKASVRRLTQEGKFFTTNGSINVVIGQGVVPVSARTTNGSINLKLPADFSGQFDAKTDNGRVRSDFPIPFTDKSKKRLSGKIGEGGSAKVKLRTTNGNINLRDW